MSSTAPGPNLCFMDARALAALIRSREISARDVMVAHLRQIERLNPTLNAIVAKLPDEECLRLADEADRRVARGEAVGPLHGLPIAFKDMQAAVGFPYTQGSPIFKDVMPETDSLLVERLRRAGVIPIGKTNVPEFGMGSQTYNVVYGTTVNPYDVTKTVGGSSGGAGAALAAGMLPIADGGDLGGSLRNPANFNNVVALRPTVGLVPIAPNPLPVLGFGVNGPMARSVSDVALLLSTMVGTDSRDPGCYPSDPRTFAEPLELANLAGVRVAWSPDLGELPLDPRVRAVIETQRLTFERLGCIVDDAVPPLAGADEVFLTLRRFRSAATLGLLLPAYRDELKAEALAEIESGAQLTSADIATAMTRHGQLMEQMRGFQDTYEFIVCAVNQVPPFDADLHWPKSINGVKMESYVAWMKSAYWISATWRPAMSVPAGFTDEGLPVGLQIVGRYREDRRLLEFAYAFEQATNIGRRHPAMAI